jgi:conjugative relaxase-like TrwC/TraI family protein
MIRNTHLTGSPAAVASYMESKHEEHMTRSGEVKATGYYSMAGGAPSEWFGKGAEAQGLKGQIVAEDMVRALSGQVKHTGEDISTRGGQTAETRRMGEELTIAAPKSVSIMAVADPRIVQAHQVAVRAAMKYVEQEMVHARLGKGGGKGNDFSGNLTAGLYVHEDARDSDTGRVAPHLHTHAVISNMTQRSDGQWVGLKLDWGHNNEKKMAADAVYKAELAREVKALGYQIEKGKGTDFEIAGITREQIEYFSPRSQDIKKEIGGERDAVSPKERQAAQNKTKGNKSTLSQIDQRYEWRREFREQNMDLQSIHANAVRREASGIPVSQITAEDAVKSAIRHLSERDSVFSEQSLKAEALAAGLGDVSPEAIDEAIESRVAGLVYAGQAEGLNDCQFTTKSALYREAEILHRAKDGQGKSEAVVPEQSVVLEVSISTAEKEYQNGTTDQPDESARDASHIEGFTDITAHGLQELRSERLAGNGQRQNSDLLPGAESAGERSLESLRLESAQASGNPRVAQIIAEREQKQGFTFGGGQRAAIELALTSTDRYMGIVGYAGAGKTTSMAVIADEYKKAGYEVIGVAPTTKAASELTSAGCDDVRTLASVNLQKIDPDKAGQPKLYIMDEAGMVSAKDLDAFLKKADAEGARILFVGDPRQLHAVEAGTPLSQILEKGVIQFATIDEIQRQKDPKLREIAQAFAKGDAARGVELAKPYMREVTVPKGEDKSVALANAAAGEYLSLTPDARQQTLVLAATNATRQAINGKVREGLRAEGSIGVSEVTVTALDKLDLTRESATRAEHYVSKGKDNSQVLVQFNADVKDKETGEVSAAKDSQWSVTSTGGGKLTLRALDDPNKQIIVDPAKARMSAYTLRDMSLSVGDQIVFRQNDTERGIINGTQGRVVGVDEKTGKAIILTATGQQVAIDPRRREVIDYSYARTVHSSQGATVEQVIVVGEASKVATAESAYVACSREKNGLTVITDNIEKLCKAWGKFADKQSALDASKIQAPESLDELQTARRAASHELGQAGDLAEKRSLEVEPEQEPEGEPEPEHAAYQFSPEPEMEMELGK